MKYLMWLLKAAIFFTLFAFALNNQQVVSVYFFFGTLWQAPLVLVVLATFTAGLALGVLLMMPRWWRKRQAARHGNGQNQGHEFAGDSALPAQNNPDMNHGI
ncbi:MAG: LapA family protein [Comamonadaceae bacterium]|nr:MAG: LapA family protein [Comamonadaceae bacterium]